MVLLSETARSPVCWSLLWDVGVVTLVFSLKPWPRLGDFGWLPQRLSLLQPLFGGETCSSISATYQFEWNLTVCLQNCSQPVAQPDLLLQTTNTCSPVLLLLIIFTLLPERVALDWSGFSCRSAYFWQYPILSDQENAGAAFSSQKALGVFSW